MGIFVRITFVLNVGMVINAPVVLSVVKWDAKRTNAEKTKTAKKTVRCARTMNVDEVAALSGIVNFMNFVLEDNVNTKNAEGRAPAASYNKT